MDQALRTITLDSATVDAAIDVLSRAAANFSMTPREQSRYRALMISVDLAIVSLIATVLVLAVTMARIRSPDSFYFLVGIGAIAFFGSTIAGVIAFVGNIPLFRRMWHERAKLKALGVTQLSKSLWKASRRHRWLTRIRSMLIVFFGGILFLDAIVYSAKTAVEFKPVDMLLVVYCAVVAVLLFGARLLRNQREQLDLAASAAEMKKALQSLREQSGATRTVVVPADLVDGVSKIESAGIAKARTEAILKSAGSESSGYAIKFDDEAAARRTQLDLADRLELEDLLAHLSTAGRPPDTQAISMSSDGSSGRSATPSKRVAIAYSIDHESRGILVREINRVSDAADRGIAGAQRA